MNASTYKHAVKCSMLYSLSFLRAAHRLISCSLSPLLPHTAFYKGFQPFLLSCYSSFSRNIRGKSSPPPISLQKNLWAQQITQKQNIFSISDQGWSIDDSRQWIRKLTISFESFPFPSKQALMKLGLSLAWPSRQRKKLASKQRVRIRFPLSFLRGRREVKFCHPSSSRLSTGCLVQLHN